MDSKNYREVISNPWRWFHTAEMLYENADALYGLYNEDLAQQREYMEKVLERENNQKLGKSFYNNTEPVDYPHIPHKPPTYTIIPVFMMLMGMAIEDMAKGITVGRKLKEDHTIADRATLVILGINKHNAPDLIKDWDITKNEIQKAILNDANEFLIWSGRYPGPSNENKEILSATIMYKTQREIIEEECLETIIAIYNQLKDIWDKESSEPPIKDWWWNHSIELVRKP